MTYIVHSFTPDENIYNQCYVDNIEDISLPEKKDAVIQIGESSYALRILDDVMWFVKILKTSDISMAEAMAEEDIPVYYLFELKKLEFKYHKLAIRRIFYKRKHFYDMKNVIEKIRGYY